MWSCIVVALFVLTTLYPLPAYAAGTPAGTVIANQTTATYTSGQVRGPLVVNSNIVGVVVNQIAVLNLFPSTASNTGQLATSVDFPARVTNSGNGQDDILFTTLSSEGLQAAVYRDLDRNSVLSPTELAAGPISQSSPLPADSTSFVVVRVTIPNLQTLNGRTDLLTFTATSQFDMSRSVIGIYSTVITSANLSITKSVDVPSPRAGDRVMYTITINNSGLAPASNISVTDNLNSNVRFATGSATPTPSSLSEQTVTWQLGTLAAQTTRTITFYVDIVNNVPPSTEIHNAADVQFNDGPNLVVKTSSETNFITVRSGGPTTVDVTADQQQHAESGDTVIYHYTITNNGQIEESFDLSLSSSLGIPWVPFEDSNANGILDPGEPEITSTGVLPGFGGKMYVLVRGTIPLVTTDQTVDVLTLHVRSTSNPDNYVSRLGSTTIGIPLMALAKTASSANPISGEEIIYIIKYGNNGHGTAYQFVVTDHIPTYTQYIAGSTLHNGVQQTDAADGDDVIVVNGVLRVTVGTVAPGSSGTVEFRVRIL